MHLSHLWPTGAEHSGAADHAGGLELCISLFLSDKSDVLLVGGGFHVARRAADHAGR